MLKLRPYKFFFKIFLIVKKLLTEINAIILADIGRCFFGRERWTSKVCTICENKKWKQSIHDMHIMIDDYNAR